MGVTSVRLSAEVEAPLEICRSDSTEVKTTLIINQAIKEFVAEAWQWKILDGKTL